VDGGGRLPGLALAGLEPTMASRALERLDGVVRASPAPCGAGPATTHAPHDAG
jgi:hypothetical protein